MKAADKDSRRGAKGAGSPSTSHSARRRARRPRPERDQRPASSSRYARIATIDGRHPLAKAVPSAIVPYPTRRQRDTKVAYFNFSLAREIGLIPSNHPDRLTSALRRTLLETFGLVIINEWDEAHARGTNARDRRPHPYMATRYLQLQHPDKRGFQSGDGRSIWNGLFRGPRGTWDVSSCGTGVTRLCPATSATGEFFETGNSKADYGCGTAHIEEGLGAALMSEAFARNGLRTERVLAVLSRPSNLAINIRVAPNLLRPSHFFGLLRRREDEDLRRLVAYYANREIADGRWPRISGERDRVRYLARRVAIDFARATASFESEYIFCWLDWDGDNILTDGSIIDYGSVRQFGLYHHSYRFEDTDRMSTSIPEQKRKARQIVRRFAQLRDLLLSGSLPSLSSLREDDVLDLFDQEFAAHRRRLFAKQMGFADKDAEALVRARPECLEALLALHQRLERRRSSRGAYRVPDGLSWNAVYCMRDVLRELPERLLSKDEGRGQRISAKAFYDIALSDYAARADREINAYRRRLASRYQHHYIEVLAWVAKRRRRAPRRLLEEITPRAVARNPYARMTGDGLTHATHRIARHRSRLAPEETFRLMQAFADFQQREDAPAEQDLSGERPLVRRLHRDLLALTRDFRESL